MEKEKKDRLIELEKKLKKKEKLFIENLEDGMCKAEAALAAGYGESQDGKQNRRSAATAASRILARDEVVEYRELRAEMIYEELGISANTVMAEIAKVHRRCMQAEEVMSWNPQKKEWEGTGEFKFDSKGALKALELMGESLGIFKNEKDSASERDVNVNINVVDKIAEKSEA